MENALETTNTRESNEIRYHLLLLLRNMDTMSEFAPLEHEFKVTPSDLLGWHLKRVHTKKVDFHEKKTHVSFLNRRGPCQQMHMKPQSMAP